jgi:anaerobic dimethyl sulfoxide reductase subunit C (anchor subunit)
MDTQDIPLVIFTILAQMSVGAFVVNGIFHVLAGQKNTQAKIDKLSDPALYAIGPVMVVALFISLAHLGDPLHALYTCENFGRSWLSREIVFGVAFAVLAIGFSVSHGRKWFSPVMLQALAGLTALFGLAFIFSQGMIYVIPTIPVWDSWATPVSFFVTTFLLGSLAVGVDFVVVTTIPRLRARHGGDTTPLLFQSLRWISASAMVLLGVQFVIEPTYALELAAKGGVAAQSANLLLFGGGSVFIVEMILFFAGGALIALFLHQLRAPGPGTPLVATAGTSPSGAVSVGLSQKVMIYAVSTAFVLVLASEVLGRILFYTSNLRIGF